MKRILATFISITIIAAYIITFTVPALAKKAAPPSNAVSTTAPAPVFKVTKPNTKSNIAADHTKKSNTVSPEADFLFDPATQTITEYIGSSDVVDIPPTINGVAVLHIGETAFKQLLVTSVTIPNGVKTIDDDAFGSCLRLTNISIPDSVTLIDANAFYDCSSLENITLPPQLETIGDSAFENCTSLKGIVIPNSVKTLGAYSFFMCFALKDLTLSNQLIKIEDYTFESCPISTIIIPDSVKQIGDGAFSAASAAESLTLSKKLEYIGKYAFANMPLIKSIEIPDSVTNINEGAFFNWNGLESITLPKNLTNIGSAAFFGDTALKSAIFTGNAPATWGTDVFSNSAAGFTIYYYAEKTGFSTPTFQEYPCYPLYQVLLAPTTGGTASVSTDRVAANSTVTVTVTPDKDYIVKAVYYTDSAGKHNIINNSFPMPESTVTVTVEFGANSLLIVFTALVLTFFLAALVYVIWWIIRR